MKGIIRYLVFALFAFILTAQCAFSDSDPVDRCDMMHKHDKMMSKMGLDDMFFFKARFIIANADKIGLNDDQIKKIKALKTDIEKGLIKNKADIEMIAIDIKSELSNEEADLNTVNTLLDKKYLIKAQIAKDSAMAYINLKKTLTNEQQKKMKDLWFVETKEGKKHMKIKDKEKR